MDFARFVESLTLIDFGWSPNRVKCVGTKNTQLATVILFQVGRIVEVLILTDTFHYARTVGINPGRWVRHDDSGLFGCRRR